MLSWAVKKAETADAILAAMKEQHDLTVAQIEELAAAHGDTVTWLLPVSGADLSRDCKA